MIAYQIIRPPFPLEFRERSKKDLETYWTWFHLVTSERIAELANAVKATPGYENWEPNGTPESLEALGQWFEGQVETRKKTAEEVEKAGAALTFPIDIPEVDLTDRTFSLAMDIGMYFGQVILKNQAGTQWDQPLQNKKFADYGQPVILGLGTVPLNPVRIAVTIAYGVSRNKPALLRNVYETWARMKR